MESDVAVAPDALDPLPGRTVAARAPPARAHVRRPDAVRVPLGHSLGVGRAGTAGRHDVGAPRHRPADAEERAPDRQRPPARLCIEPLGSDRARVLRSLAKAGKDIAQPALSLVSR